MWILVINQCCINECAGSGTVRAELWISGRLVIVDAVTRHSASSKTLFEQQMQENGLREVCGGWQRFKYSSRVGWVGILVILSKLLSFAGIQKRGLIAAKTTKIVFFYLLLPCYIQCSGNSRFDPMPIEWSVAAAYLENREGGGGKG